MKKTFFSITLVTVMAASGVVHALPVGETTARAAAVNWFAQVSGRDSPVLDEFIAVRGDAGGVYFVGNFSGGGFVLVAGDDAAGPILAYSKESSFVTPPESPAVAYWMSFYARELDKAAAARLVDPLKKRVWNLVVSGQRSLLQRSVSRVEPLVNAMWGQGTYFNAMCPRDDLSYSDVRVVVGCVATAMSMIMWYFKHPVRGVGEHSYDSNYGTLTANFGGSIYKWWKMPASLMDYNSDVALISYHAGVSVDMQYDPYGSGSYVYLPDADSDAFRAFSSFFGYKPTAAHAYRDEYEESGWAALLKSELDAARPMLYAGAGESGPGHAFVCDGYDENGLFHFNWGWNGSANGYYSFQALSPGGYNFNYYQEIIYNLERDGCECSEGVCCSGCQFKDQSSVCKEDEKSELRCSEGEACGGAVERRTMNRFCSGSSSGCDGREEWSAWQEKSYCLLSQLCQAGDDGTVSCQNCPGGCAGNSCRVVQTDAGVPDSSVQPDGGGGDSGGGCSCSLVSL